MKPADFRPWAEEQLAQSPAIASVEAVQDDRPGHDYITYTHTTFRTGARVVIQWISSDPVGGKNLGPDGAVIETGPPPAPVPVPELATSGRLNLLNVETHFAALLNNGGHRAVAEVLGYHQRPDQNREQRAMQYGLLVRCHSGETVMGMLVHTLPAGQQPSEANKYKQLADI